MDKQQRFQGIVQHLGKFAPLLRRSIALSHQFIKYNAAANYLSTKTGKRGNSYPDSVQKEQNEVTSTSSMLSVVSLAVVMVGYVKVTAVYSLYAKLS